jgi:hypothetical protein
MVWSLELSRRQNISGWEEEEEKNNLCITGVSGNICHIPLFIYFFIYLFGKNNLYGM